MLAKPCEYSRNEKKLIRGLSPHWAEIIEKHYMPPINLYKILAIECFINKRDDEYAEALRRALEAIEVFGVYRMTEEFEEIIHIKNKEELDASNGPKLQ